MFHCGEHDFFDARMFDTPRILFNWSLEQLPYLSGFWGHWEWASEAVDPQGAEPLRSYVWSTCRSSRSWPPEVQRNVEGEADSGRSTFECLHCHCSLQNHGGLQLLCGFGAAMATESWKEAGSETSCHRWARWARWGDLWHNQSQWVHPGAIREVVGTALPAHPGTTGATGSAEHRVGRKVPWLSTFKMKAEAWSKSKHIMSHVFLLH